MVQFNELRIGSWILEDGRPIKIIAIEYGAEPYCRINETIASKKDMAEIFESIPITAEFLKRAGFVGYEDQARLTMTLQGQFQLHYSQSRKVFYINEQELPRSPSYVHQFQNLYLSFTGLDLDVML
jgi:hypothetical protein